MSGGYFDYVQTRLTWDVEEQLRALLNPVTVSERFSFEPVEDPFNEEDRREFRNALYHTKKAAIYLQRVDWYVSGDDGQESFHERLKEELDELETWWKSFKNGEENECM